MIRKPVILLALLIFLIGASIPTASAAPKTRRGGSSAVSCLVDGELAPRGLHHQTYIKRDDPHPQRLVKIEVGNECDLVTSPPLLNIKCDGVEYRFLLLRGTAATIEHNELAQVGLFLCHLESSWLWTVSDGHTYQFVVGPGDSFSRA